MYLPKIYEKFSGKFPDVFKDFKQLGQTCRKAGPLDQKSQHAQGFGGRRLGR
jgi:alkylhydroperoxidase/carboxymuconolactone decarboxylase family protein YurZ